MQKSNKKQQTFISDFKSARGAYYAEYGIPIYISDYFRLYFYVSVLFSLSRSVFVEENYN